MARLFVVVSMMLGISAHAAMQADVIVYGATPGGFCAAIAAAREGVSVILLEPTGHVGGVNTGGLSFSDSNQTVRSTLRGLFEEWHSRIEKDYRDRGVQLPYQVSVKDQTHWTYEPHVAAGVTNSMLAEAGVTVMTRRVVKLVEKEGNQITRLKTIKQNRDPALVAAALSAITSAAVDGTGNLLDLSIQAMRLRATVGEVSDALEHAFGRHRADTNKVSGVYAAAYDSAEGDTMDYWNALKADIADFAEQQGRRPRVMISKLGQDGHDRGAKVVATAFADLGFDVDMGPLFQTPEECARQAIENDVHAVGVSTLAAGHKTLVPAIIAELKKQGADDIIVFVGGVVPRQDYDFLYAAGVKGIYGPGTPIPVSAQDVLAQIKKATAS